MSAHDDIPSDCEPNPVIRAKHLTLRQKIARFVSRPEVTDSNVIEFRPAQMARQQTALDLANAFRSADAGKYDPIDPDDKGAA